MSACPSEASIESFLRGAAGTTSRAALEAHVDGCGECLELLAALAPAGSVAPHGELAPGDRIGRYTVLRSVGRGAMGEVFAAHDRELDRTVAIKVWTHESKTRLLVEARGLARVRDPNVVALHDVGTHGDRSFAVMELVEGWTLAQWIALRRREWREVLDAVLQAGRGLAAVHGERLVHRDFKPDNVLVGRDGRVRVADLGLGIEPTRRWEGGLVGDGLYESTVDMLAGTPAYMAPELLRGGEADAASDQYAYAVVVWESLFGRRPFVGRDLLAQLELAERGCCSPPRGTSVPRRVVRLLMRALAPDPRERFGSVAELVDELRTATRSRLASRAIRVGVLFAAASACTALGQAAVERIVATAITSPSSEAP